MEALTERFHRVLSLDTHVLGTGIDPVFDPHVERHVGPIAPVQRPARGVVPPSRMPMSLSEWARWREKQPLQEPTPLLTVPTDAPEQRAIPCVHRADPPALGAGDDPRALETRDDAYALETKDGTCAQSAGFGEHLILDTEGFVFGCDGPVAHTSYAMYIEAAIVRVRVIDDAPKCEVVYNKTIAYDIGRTIDGLNRCSSTSDEAAGVRADRKKWMSTYHFAKGCNGCRASGKGIDPHRALEEVREVIASYPYSQVWAKGVALERRFLGGHVNVPVRLRSDQLPLLYDLVDIGCPRFDDLPSDLKELGFSVVDPAHIQEFHPLTKEPHCCVAECLAFAMWMAREWKRDPGMFETRSKHVD